MHDKALIEVTTEQVPVPATITGVHQRASSDHVVLFVLYCGFHFVETNSSKEQLKAIELQVCELFLTVVKTVLAVTQGIYSVKYIPRGRDFAYTFLHKKSIAAGAKDD